MQVAARRQHKKKTEQPLPQPDTAPTHATGPGHMPNTGRNNSLTAPGAQINADVMMVVVAAPADLADVVMVAGDPGAADRSG